MPHYFTIKTSNGKECRVNLDNIADICLAKNDVWKLEFCIAGGQVERLTFQSNDFEGPSSVLEDIIEYCKSEKISMIIRRNRDNVRQRDDHVLVAFAKYNAYVNGQTGVIIDVDNRKWNIRSQDYVEEFLYEETDDTTENESYQINTDEILEKYQKDMKEFLEGELKKIDKSIKYNTYEKPVFTNSKKDETVKSETIDIPSSEEIKRSIEENRNSFLRRNR